MFLVLLLFLYLFEDLLHAYFKVFFRSFDDYCLVCSEFMLWLLILLVFSSCSVILQASSDGSFFFLLPLCVCVRVCVSLLSLCDFPCWSSRFAVVSAWLWSSQIRIRSVLVDQSPGPMVTLGISQIQSLRQLALGQPLPKL